MQTIDIMGRTEKLFEQPSALSNELDWSSPVPDKNSTTRIIPLTKGKFAVVDAADFEWLSQWKWAAMFLPKTHSYYAVRGVGKKTLLMHREICKAPSGMDVDHRDGNGLNNTRPNVRLATRSQNNFNASGHKGSVSGHRGVDWMTSKHKWRARICVNQKIIHLGIFSKKEDAIAAYDAKAIELVGEFYKA